MEMAYINFHIWVYAPHHIFSLYDVAVYVQEKHNNYFMVSLFVYSRSIKYTWNVRTLEYMMRSHYFGVRLLVDYKSLFTIDYNLKPQSFCKLYTPLCV